MERIASAWLAAALTAGGCAARRADRAPSAELVMGIDAQALVRRIEFRREGTWQSFVVTPPTGASIHRLAVPAGRYCLVGYIVDQGPWGGVAQFEGPRCFDVPASTQAYVGHFVFDPTGRFRVRYEPDRVERQLQASDVPVLRPRM